LVQLDLDFIKKKRIKLGLSLQEMANRMGFKNGSTYLKYEQGSYSFKADHLPTLSLELDCNIADFFTQNVAKIEIINREGSVNNDPS